MYIKYLAPVLVSNFDKFSSSISRNSSQSLSEIGSDYPKWKFVRVNIIIGFGQFFNRHGNLYFAFRPRLFHFPGFSAPLFAVLNISIRKVLLNNFAGAKTLNFGFVCGGDHGISLNVLLSFFGDQICIMTTALEMHDKTVALSGISFLCELKLP